MSPAVPVIRLKLDHVQAACNPCDIESESTVAASGERLSFHSESKVRRVYGVCAAGLVASSSQTAPSYAASSKQFQSLYA